MERSEISQATGFDSGDEFTSEAQVREYFTVEAMGAMFGDSYAVEEEGRVQVCTPALPTQADLDAMADAVIEHRWHCAF